LARAAGALRKARRIFQPTSFVGSILKISATPLYGVDPVSGTPMRIVGIDVSPSGQLALLAVRQDGDELVPVRLPRVYAVPDKPAQNNNKAST
jgi:hypothetical protein